MSPLQRLLVDAGLDLSTTRPDGLREGGGLSIADDRPVPLWRSEAATATATGMAEMRRTRDTLDASRWSLLQTHWGKGMFSFFKAWKRQRCTVSRAK